MPRVCAICSHPKRSAIDKALVGGEGDRGVARRFAVSEDAMRRHRLNHLARSIDKAQAAVKLRVAAAVEEKIEAEELAPLDVMAELQRIFQRMHRMLDACDDWLSDPDHPTRYELGPRAHELMVIYDEQTGEDDNGRPIIRRRKKPLQELLAIAEGIEAVTRITLVETKHADPRKLIIETANQLRGNIELLARIAGDINDPATVELRILNMVVNRPAEAVNGR